MVAALDLTSFIRDAAAQGAAGTTRKTSVTSVSPVVKGFSPVAHKLSR